jgi:hypothetical protein
VLTGGRVAIGVLWAEPELEAGRGRRGGGGRGRRFVVPDLREIGEEAVVGHHLACAA